MIVIWKYPLKPGAQALDVPEPCIVHHVATDPGGRLWAWIEVDDGQPAGRGEPVKLHKQFLHVAATGESLPTGNWAYVGTIHQAKADGFGVKMNVNLVWHVFAEKRLDYLTP